MDFSSRLPAMVAVLKYLVETESPTYDKAAVNRMGAVVAREAGKLGANIEVLPKADVGDIVIARWGEGTDGTADRSYRHGIPAWYIRNDALYREGR